MRAAAAGLLRGAAVPSPDAPLGMDLFLEAADLVCGRRSDLILGEPPGINPFYFIFLAAFDGCFDGKSLKLC